MTRNTATRLRFVALCVLMLPVTAVAQRLRENPEKSRQRGSIVEHPFGTLKDRLNRDHFVCRGLALVGAEISLAALAYNLTRAIKILGIPRLLQEIQNWNPATPGPHPEKISQAALEAA
jgi:hypothetical protein